MKRDKTSSLNGPFSKVWYCKRCDRYTIEEVDNTSIKKLIT